VSNLGCPLDSFRSGISSSAMAGGLGVLSSFTGALAAPRDFLQRLGRAFVLRRGVVDLSRYPQDPLRRVRPSHDLLSERKTVFTAVVAFGTNAMPSGAADTNPPKASRAESSIPSSSPAMNRTGSRSRRSRRADCFSSTAFGHAPKLPWFRKTMLSSNSQRSRKLKPRSPFPIESLLAARAGRLSEQGYELAAVIRAPPEVSNP